MACFYKYITHISTVYVFEYSISVSVYHSSMLFIKITITVGTGLLYQIYLSLRLHCLQAQEWPDCTVTHTEIKH